MKRTLFFLLCLDLSACSMRALVDIDTSQNKDATVEDGVVNSYNGAVGLYRNAIGEAAMAAAFSARQVGLITDELSASESNNAANDDARQNLESGDVFSTVSRMRVAAQYGIGALQRYPSQRPAAYVGELYGLLGMAEVILAETMCSGIPLMTTPYRDNPQSSAALSTTQVMQHAIEMFDSALVYGKDSLPIATLARVGKGRALLYLGNIVDAAKEVTDVPTNAVYRTYYLSGHEWMSDIYVALYRIVNNEGNNGLDWIASGGGDVVQDPRVPIENTNGVIRQAKYPMGTTTQTIASGIEARLIEAEAALRADDIDVWANTLNTLRTTAITPAIPALSLDSTTAADSATRVDVMFRERAFWLYLTGHRQGDLRRLIRQYGRTVSTTYPVGGYPFPTADRVLYNNLVTLTPKASEIQQNPMYTGCIDREP